MAEGETAGDDAVADEATAGGDTDETPADTRPWAPTALMVGLGLVMILLIVGLVIQTSRASDLSSDEDERRAVGRAAGGFTEAVYGYDHEDMQESLAAVLEHATDEYAREYEEAWNNELQPVIDELRGSGEIDLTDVYVSDIDGNRAKAVVSFNATLRSTAGARRLTGTFVQIDLQRVDGAWLVADYKLLATTDETQDPPGAEAGGGGGAGGASTTTTTAAPG